MKITQVLFAFALMSLVFASCKDETSTTEYTIRLTDGPGPFTAVNIDIQSIELTGKNSELVTLNTMAGIYNLLDLTNGVDTIIATAGLEISQVKQIRLILGPNNTVEINGQIYPLSTPSADQSGLKIKVNHTLQPGEVYPVLLDFDAAKSIVETGKGEYKLKPVLRTIDKKTTGTIKGAIQPKTISAVIEVSGNGNSYSTIANKDGKFMIQGLAAGDYTVTIIPAPPYLSMTLNNVNVVIGHTTDMGKLQL
jgi:hypothetical protein